MTDELDVLKDELARLQRRVDELQSERDDRVINRRTAFKALGAAAAGAAVGGIAFANPAAATDGSSVLIGNEVQTAQSPTVLIASSYSQSGNKFAGFTVTDETSPSVNANAALSAIAGIGTGTDFSIGLFGKGSGLGAKLDGPTPLKLTDSTSAGPPSGSSGSPGQFKVDSGDLYFCVNGSGSDRWRIVTGAAAAGAFVALDPARVYDSRWADGPLGTGSTRVVSVKDKRNSSGGLVTPNIVPAGARAITYNLTIADTTLTGYLSCVPGNSSDFSTSSINWSFANALLANGSTVKLDTSRQVKVFCGGGGSSNFIVDVTGYYL